MAGPSTLAETGSITREAPAVPFLYRALRPPLRQALVRWFDLRVDGLEHLPASGPYLIAANQAGESVVVFRIDHKTGHLTPTGSQQSMPQPGGLAFVKIQ